MAGFITVFAIFGLDQAIAQSDILFHGEEVDQIEPPSPVAGGNDPNRSDDALYILQSLEEELQEEAEVEKGSIKRAMRPHLFIGPSARLAARKVISPKVSVEAFVTSGLVDFRQDPKPFETRDSSISGGITSTADFGLLNGSFAYEHRNAYAQSFSTWKSNADKIGATFNKTLPFFVSDLTVTPQLLLADEMATPIGGSAKTVEPTAGFTYTATRLLSFAVSVGYSYVDLFNLPGYRHDNGLKLTLGATYKFSDRLIVTAGASTNRTVLYGFPEYRANGALSPNMSIRYNVMPNASISLSANYARFLTTVPGGSTFKYNLNPTVALTVPL